MTNFSTNQVMQFYVLGNDAPGESTIPGRGISLLINGKRTDIIENILWGKLTTADALATPCKEVTLKVGSVATKENHIVRVSYPEVFGAGKESWTTKTVVVTPTDNNPDNIQGILVEQLEAVLPSYITVKQAPSAVITFAANPDIAGYKRGLHPVVMPDFEVSVNKVIVDGDEVDWAEVSKPKASTTVPDVSGSYKLADMEYFALGERGDEYRQMGWPVVTYDADYKIDVKKDYDVLVVHYGYRGSNDQAHLSEKDLIIAAPAAEGGNEALLNLTTTLKTLGGTFTKVSGNTETTI